MLENLCSTLYLLVDTVKIVLFIIVSFKELVYYSYYIFNNENNIINDTFNRNIDFRKMLINGLILFIVTAFGKHIIFCVMDLF